MKWAQLTVAEVPVAIQLQCCSVEDKSLQSSSTSEESQEAG